MNTVSEQVERLIVRRLDGELSPEEQLELDRELIRDPAARALYERYAGIDAVAARVLGRVATPRVPDVAISPGPSVVRASRDHARAWWMIAGSAIAASLALVILIKTPLAPAPTKNPNPVAARDNAWTPAMGQPVPVLAPSGKDVGVWQVPSNRVPPQVDRAVKRNLIVVPGSDGSYYLLNLEQVRELQQPARRSPSTDPI